MAILLFLVIGAIMAYMMFKVLKSEDNENTQKEEQEQPKNKNSHKWLIAIIILATLVLSRPSTLEEFGHDLDKRYYKIESYGIMSVCYEAYGGKWDIFSNEYRDSKWRAKSIGILGITIDLK